MSTVAIAEPAHENVSVDAAPPFYPISPLKAVLLSAATFGIYNLWWFYQHWRHHRRASGRLISPLFRALFSPVYCFSLFREIEEDLRDVSMSMVLPPPLLGVLFVVPVMLGWAPGPYWLLYFLNLVPLAIVQAHVVRLVRKRGLEVDRRFGFLSGVTLSLGGIAWIMVVIGMMMPDPGVREGGEMKRSEIEYLVDKGYLAPQEDILFFYSSGVFSIHDDGNILTKDRVISYENRHGLEYHEFVYYEDIYAVDVVFSDSWLDDTRVTVTRNDGEEVYLVVSADGGKDRVFVEHLRKEWRRRVPEGEEVLRAPEPNRAGSGPTIIS